MSHFSIDIAADRALDLAIEKVENMAMSAVKRGLIMRGVVPPSTDPDVAREDLINKMAVELFEKEMERPGPHGQLQERPNKSAEATQRRLQRVAGRRFARAAP